MKFVFTHKGDLHDVVMNLLRQDRVTLDDGTRKLEVMPQKGSPTIENDCLPYRYTHEVLIKGVVAEPISAHMSFLFYINQHRVELDIGTRHARECLIELFDHVHAADETNFEFS
jgi:hypothetical protein